MLVVNKIDMVTKDVLASLSDQYKDAVFISSIVALLTDICDKLSFLTSSITTFLVPQDDNNVITITANITANQNVITPLFREIIVCFNLSSFS